MAGTATVASKKSFREAFFAEAERKDPNKKTIWELLVGPAFVLIALITLGTLVVALIAFAGFLFGDQGNLSSLSADVASVFPSLT